MLVQSLIEANLIDELRLLVHPVVMGKGKRCFKEDSHIVAMTLTQSQVLDKGVIALCYRTNNS